MTVSNPNFQVLPPVVHVPLVQSATPTPTSSKVEINPQPLPPKVFGQVKTAHDNLVNQAQLQGLFPPVITKVGDGTNPASTVRNPMLTNGIIVIGGKSMIR